MQSSHCRTRSALGLDRFRRQALGPHRLRHSNGEPPEASAGPAFPDETRRVQLQQWPTSACEGTFPATLVDF